MRQRGQLDPVEADPLQPLLPRLGEAVPGLGAVADDGEAARRAALQQHLPLGVGELLGLVDDDVGERAGEQVRVGGRAGRPRRRDALRRSSPRSIDITCISESSVAIRWSTTWAICSRSAATAASVTAPAARGLGVAEPLPRRVEQRQVGHRPGLGVGALQQPHLVRGRATGRTGAGTPAPTRGRRRGRSARAAARPGRRCVDSSSFCGSDRRSSSAADLLVVDLVDEDGRRAPPRPRRAPRCAACPGSGGVERLGPVVGAEPAGRPTASRPPCPRWAAPRRRGRPARWPPPSPRTP